MGETKQKSSEYEAAYCSCSVSENVSIFSPEMCTCCTLKIEQTVLLKIDVCAPGPAR